MSQRFAAQLLLGMFIGKNGLRKQALMAFQRSDLNFSQVRAGFTLTR